MTNSYVKEEYNEWNDSDTVQFLKFGKAYIPDRDRLGEIFATLINIKKKKDFTFVDICSGGGWLTEALLTKFPQSKAIALDGSELMLKQMSERLNNLEDRITYKQFDIFDKDWEKELGEVDYFVSSLAIHHLDDQEKEELFERLYKVLPQKGGLIILDLINPISEEERKVFAREWNYIVEKQSIELFGNLDAYNFFVDDQWNYFLHPDDPIDKPSALMDQIKWLQRAGYYETHSVQVLAGHAIISGFKFPERV